MVVGNGTGQYSLADQSALRLLPPLQSASVVIQRVMNLVMPIRRSPGARRVSPETKADLVMALARERDAITTAMDNLGTVHFARFNIVGDDLHLISVYDGTAHGYLNDFAVHLGPAFDVILSFVADWPPPMNAADGKVSVRDHPAEFVEWVLHHDILQLPRDPSALVRDKLAGGHEGGPSLGGMLREYLVAHFKEHDDAHLSIHRGYPGRTVAQIRDALDVGW